MKFYIHPEDREALERKLARMFKKLSNKPTVEFSDVQNVTSHTIISYGSEGYDKYKEIIKALEVTIEGLEYNEWTIVAEVDYKNSQMLICNSKLFKSIPAKYGLDYTTCDHCGGNRHRITAFVVHNNNTGEWMQVGSSCVSKLFGGGKYLADLIIDLWNFIKMSIGGCDEFGFWGGSWQAPEKWRAKAVRFIDAITLCKKIYDEKNGEIKWVKPEYEYGKKVKSGTNDFLIEEMECAKVEVDDEYISKVKAHVSTLDPENEFNKKMQEAFENEYIELQQMYLAFFAMKSYEDSIKFADFELALAERGIKRDAKLALTCKMIAKEVVMQEDYYFGGCSYITYLTFKDVSGFTFVKSVSYIGVVSSYCTETLDSGTGVTESDYMNKTYKFNCSVKYISCKKKEIGLGGRLSKYNAKKADIVL